MHLYTVYIEIGKLWNLGATYTCNTDCLSVWEIIFQDYFDNKMHEFHLSDNMWLPQYEVKSYRLVCKRILIRPAVRSQYWIIVNI